MTVTKSSPLSDEYLVKPREMSYLASQVDTLTTPGE